MMSRPTRTLVDITALVGVVWMWIAIYQSFTKTGLWTIMSRALGGAGTLPSQTAVLAVCVLFGWLSLGTTCWLLWRIFLRPGIDEDFPAARLLR